MIPKHSRVMELRERFGVWSGQFWGYYKYKNLNWYLVTFTEADNQTNDIDFTNGEWFCFGDIRDEDPDRLKDILKPGEALVLGWKELGADVREDRFFGNGGDIWLIITTGGVRYDVMKHKKDILKAMNGG